MTDLSPGGTNGVLPKVCEVPMFAEAAELYLEDGARPNGEGEREVGARLGPSEDGDATG